MKRRVTQAASGAKSKRSRADQSAVKRLMSLLKCGGDMRVRKVKRVRAAVRTRSYENELKLSVAMERLARELCSK